MTTEKQLDPDLDNETAKILIAFCIHEHLYYPTTKKMFLEKPEEVQKEHLKMMRDVTGNPLFDQKLYRDFLAKEAKKPEISVK